MPQFHLHRIHCELLVAWLLLGMVAVSSAAEEPVFSGPQPGEKLAEFKVRELFGDAAGSEVDLVARADGKPIVLVFLHEVTRPSIGLARTVLTYAHSRAKDGLHAGLILLSADATAREDWAKRAKHALPAEVPVGVSLDGQEGPGAYGLNRNVALTVLVGKDGRVTANFALVQPSLPTDAPRIAKAIVELLGGGEVPTLAALIAASGGPPAGRPVASNRPAAAQENLRPLLAPVIALKAEPAEVEAAAAKVEAAAKENPAVRQQIGDVARRIIAAGKLSDYGTPTAQKYLKKWAEEFRAPDARTVPPSDRDAPTPAPSRQP